MIKESVITEFLYYSSVSTCDLVTAPVKIINLILKWSKDNKRITTGDRQFIICDSLQCVKAFFSSRFFIKGIHSSGYK